MKSLNEKSDCITTIILIILGLVMLFTHPWAFGIVGAILLLWKLINPTNRKKKEIDEQ